MAVVTHLPCRRSRGTELPGVVLWWPFARASGPASPLRVPGVGREIVVEIAAAAPHWEAAFRLVQQRYEEHGYAARGSGTYRFTPYHALPTAAVLVARQGDRVLATMSLFLDSSLGLPSDAIFGPEMARLRRAGRHLAEGGNLADQGLHRREFLPVFIALNRLAWQYGIRQGADTVVISSTPRHGLFYRKMMGYLPLGASRPYAYVEGVQAEGHWLDVPRLRSAAPAMHRQLLGTPLPPTALEPRPLPEHLVRYFGSRSSLAGARRVEELLQRVRRPRPRPAGEARGGMVSRFFQAGATA